MNFLSFKNRKQNSKCPKSQPGVVFKGTIFLGYEVCLRYIDIYIHTFCVCECVQETNIEPQTHDICMCLCVCVCESERVCVCVCVCKGALCALFYKCTYM